MEDNASAHPAMTTEEFLWLPNRFVDVVEA